MLTPLRYRAVVLVAVLCGLIPVTAFGDNGDPSFGRLDLVALGFAPAPEPAVDLVIGTAEFALAALAAQTHDPDLAALLANVESFCLVQFVPPDQATVIAASALPDALTGAGWQLVQAESQDTRQVTVHLRMAGAVIAGLTVIAIDAGAEVSIANVVGNIQPPQLATLGLPIPQ